MPPMARLSVYVAAAALVRALVPAALRGGLRPFLERLTHLLGGPARRGFLLREFVAQGLLPGGLVLLPLPCPLLREFGSQPRRAVGGCPAPCPAS